MKDRFKFRAVMKTDDLFIVVPVEAVHSTYYIIDTNVAKEIFDKKYPEKCFFSDFFEIVEKQEYISQYSFDCDLLITKDFTNLMQSTGLKDKNGKLIYEGDIVKDDFDDIARVKYSSHLQRLHLFFNLGSRKHLDNYTKCGVHILDWIYPVVSLEVIGNIYEDPELLKGGNNEIQL